MAKSLQHRFESKVKKGTPDECWEWIGGKDGQGYGRIRPGVTSDWKLEKVGAHQVSLWLYKGLRDSNMCVLHSCDNPSCVNPNHLSLGTHADNMRDMSAKGRAGNHKYSAEEWEEVYSLLEDGLSQKQVEVITGIPQQSISKHLRRQL